MDREAAACISHCGTNVFGRMGDAMRCDAMRMHRFSVIATFQRRGILRPQLKVQKA